MICFSQKYVDIAKNNVGDVEYDMGEDADWLDEEDPEETESTDEEFEGNSDDDKEKLKIVSTPEFEENFCQISKQRKLEWQKNTITEWSTFEEEQNVLDSKGQRLSTTKKIEKHKRREVDSLERHTESYLSPQSLPQIQNGNSNALEYFEADRCIAIPDSTSKKTIDTQLFNMGSHMRRVSTITHTIKKTTTSTVKEFIEEILPIEHNRSLPALPTKKMVEKNKSKKSNSKPHYEPTASYDDLENVTPVKTKRFNNLSRHVRTSETIIATPTSLMKSREKSIIIHGSLVEKQLNKTLGDVELADVAEPEYVIGKNDRLVVLHDNSSKALIEKNNVTGGSDQLLVERYTTPIKPVIGRFMNPNDAYNAEQP